ncbi:MAG: hypothetical protein WC284_08770 [Candidimonas sp.]
MKSDELISNLISSFISGICFQTDPKEIGKAAEDFSQIMKITSNLIDEYGSDKITSVSFDKSIDEVRSVVATVIDESDLPKNSTIIYDRADKTFVVGHSYVLDLIVMRMS